MFQNNEDIQHKVIVHDAFGKGFIKSVKVGLSVLCSKKKKKLFCTRQGLKNSESIMTNLFVQNISVEFRC